MRSHYRSVLWWQHWVLAYYYEKRAIFVTDTLYHCNVRKHQSDIDRPVQREVSVSKLWLEPKKWNLKLLAWFYHGSKTDLDVDIRNNTWSMLIWQFSARPCRQWFLLKLLLNNVEPISTNTCRANRGRGEGEYATSSKQYKVIVVCLRGALIIAVPKHLHSWGLVIVMYVPHGFRIVESAGKNSILYFGLRSVLYYTTDPSACFALIRILALGSVRVTGFGFIIGIFT